MLGEASLPRSRFKILKKAARETKERQASKKFYNKCSENSRSQIAFRTDIFRKLTLGAPDTGHGGGTIFNTDICSRGEKLNKTENERVKK